MQRESWTKNELKELTYRVVGCAMEVHKIFGPGLLEENYEDCLATELEMQGIGFVRQQELQVVYKNRVMPRHYRMDLVVENILVVELKSVKELQAIHKAQLLTYMKLAKMPKGILINFNTRYLKKGASWIPLVNDQFKDLPEDV
jgi:GxxExxY protein